MSTTHKSTHGFAEVAGTRLCYEIAGEGYPLVLMHGVAHLPNMERPAEFNRLVLDFLKAL